MCTSYTSLRPSWTLCALHEDQYTLLKCRCRSQRSLCNSQKSKFRWYLSVRTSERSMHTSHLSLSPSKTKDQWVLLKWWCALLKTSTAHFFSIALRTSDISTALFWSAILRTHFRKKLLGLTLFAMGTHCARGRFFCLLREHQSEVYLWGLFVPTSSEI